MIYHNRQFLNKLPSNSLAAICVDLYKDDRECLEEDQFYGQVIISDCNKTISLEIDISDPESTSNSFNKIDTMIRMLEEVRSEMYKCVKPNETYTHNSNKSE